MTSRIFIIVLCHALSCSLLVFCRAKVLHYYTTKHDEYVMILLYETSITIMLFIYPMCISDIVLF